MVEKLFVAYDNGLQDLIVEYSGLSTDVIGSYTPGSNFAFITIVNNRLLGKRPGFSATYVYNGIGSGVYVSGVLTTANSRDLSYLGSELINCNFSTGYIEKRDISANTLTGSFNTGFATNVLGGLANNNGSIIVTPLSGNSTYAMCFNAFNAGSLIGSFDLGQHSIAATSFSGNLVLLSGTYLYKYNGISSNSIGSVDYTFNSLVPWGIEYYSQSSSGPTTNTINISDTISNSESLSNLVRTGFKEFNDSMSISENIVLFRANISTSITINDSISLSDSQGFTSPPEKFIKTKFMSDGVEYFPTKTNIKKTISDYGESSNFSASIPSPFGKLKDKFTVGDEIIMYADYTNRDPSTILFRGRIETIEFEGEESKQKVNLRGRDYTSLLFDVTIQPIVYTDSEVSNIVKDLISREVSGITTNNVDTTSTTVTRIAFSHDSVYNALRRLSDLSGFVFYVDENKDLHFEEADTSTASISLSNSNISSLRFDTTREGFVNSVWVYGDRQLVPISEQFNADGGSSFDLVSRPTATNVYTSDLGGPLAGGIFYNGISATSGPQYLVDYYGQKIVFVSGTSIGYSTIPSSGGSVICNYQRDIPIVKYGKDDTSIALYGIKETAIIDPTIKDVATATQVLNAKLENSDPLNKFEIDYIGYDDVIPGQLIDIYLNDFNINTTARIIGIDYTFTKETIYDQKIMSFQLEKKITDLTDKIRDIEERVRKLEGANLLTADYLTRLQEYTGSCLIVGSYYQIRTRNVGSALIIGHPKNGAIGSTTTAGYFYIGDGGVSAYSTLRSGGYSY